MSKKRHDAFRDGKVYVLSEKCKKCPFQPKNRHLLNNVDVRQQINDALARQGAILCPVTKGSAVCRGFMDHYETAPLALARKRGHLHEMPPPR